ncbi:hypothetical protein XENOCAPTIV_021189 [Xenoophorus captivus]|uniref:Uncharacterized protein n=1 Tax=Xenoophorus captivus TaxID=1517983 RepID=A0ABV0SDN6_9TELE
MGKVRTSHPMEGFKNKSNRWQRTGKSTCSLTANGVILKGQEKTRGHKRMHPRHVFEDASAINLYKPSLIIRGIEKQQPSEGEEKIMCCSENKDNSVKTRKAGNPQNHYEYEKKNCPPRILGN